MQREKQIEIALIDHNELYREGMKHIINSDENFHLIAEGGSKGEALKVIQRYKPDIVIIDSCLINKVALMQLKEMLATIDETKVVLVEGDEFSKEYFMKAVHCGINGYMLKNITDDLFIQALQKVYTKDYWFDPDVSIYLMEEYQSLTNKYMDQEVDEQMTINKPINILTAKEYEVLELLAAGYGNVEIMEEMDIKGSTVKTHIKNILDKLYVNNRTNAVLLAIQNRWVAVNYKKDSAQEEYHFV